MHAALQVGDVVAEIEQFAPLLLFQGLVPVLEVPVASIINRISSEQRVWYDTVALLANMHAHVCVNTKDQQQCYQQRCCRYAPGYVHLWPFAVLVDPQEPHTRRGGILQHTQHLRLCVGVHTVTFGRRGQGDGGLGGGTEGGPGAAAGERTCVDDVRRSLCGRWRGRCGRCSVCAYTSLAPRLLMLYVQYVPFKDVDSGGETEVVDKFVSVDWVAQIVAPRGDLLRVVGTPMHIAQQVAEASLGGEGGDVFKVITSLVLG